MMKQKNQNTKKSIKIINEAVSKVLKSLYLYIRICVCVCVCDCMYVRRRKKLENKCSFSGRKTEKLSSLGDEIVTTSVCFTLNFNFS